MKKLLGLACLVLVGTVGWRIGNQLSSDAISMALGVFFGVLAGIPAALLVLASDRRHQSRQATHAYGMPQQPPPSQPPVIVLNGSGGALPAPYAAGHPGHRQQHQGYQYNDYFDPNAQNPQFLYQQHQFAMAGGPQAEWPARRFKVVGEQEEWIEEW